MRKQPSKAIIIGAGIAGIATAIRLAVQGISVHIYDKNTEAGGKLSYIAKDGFFWDKGPSLFTQPENIEALFRLACEPIADYFSYSAQEIACTYFYEDGTIVYGYTDQKAFDAELATKNNEEDASVLNYLKDASNAYKAIGNIFLNKSLHKRTTWWHRSIFSALKTLKLAYLTSSMHKYNAAMFTHKRTVQLFDRFATYNGSNPYKAPAMLSMIAHLEHNEGTYYARGGMITIPTALEKLARKLGVQFHLGSPVDSILVENNQVTGIELNKKKIPADIIVSNADVYFTYKNLLHDNAMAERYKKQERSSSAFIFYWGIAKEFKELGLHNILFSKDYEAEFTSIFSTKELYHDPTIYINISSKLDASHAPAGSENWFVMVNVPAGLDTSETETVQALRETVINKINRILKTELEENIVQEHHIGPKDIEADTLSYLGALYGTSSNAPLAAFLRHPNFSKKIKNLYFCGGTVHPGGGIPLCLASASIVSDMVAKAAAE